MDSLSNVRRIKCLTIVDDFTKECLDIPVALGFCRSLDPIAALRGYPSAVRTDPGPEFTGKALDQWAYENKVELKLIQPGKPMQNGYIESFNGKFRDKWNELWLGIWQARQLIIEWRVDYNEERPHSSLGYQTPLEFASAFRQQAIDSTTNNVIINRLD